MFQNRKESLMAVISIIFVALLSFLDIIDRNVGMLLAVVIFALSELMTCYNLKKRNENWKKEAIYGAAMIALIVFLLFY